MFKMREFVFYSISPSHLFFPYIRRSIRSRLSTYLGGDGLNTIARYSEIIAVSVLYVYVVELILNRLLIRTLIFIPPGPIQALLAGFTSVVGLLSINYIIIASIFLLAFRYRSIISIPIIILALIDIVLKTPIAIYGVLVIGALLLIYDRARIIESLFLIFAALTQIIYTPGILVATHILWLLAPILFIRRENIGNLKWSIPISLIALVFIYRDPYIASQIFNLGMGLLNPWFIPIGIILYSLASSRSLYMVFLTGPQIQLLNQVLAISSIYINDVFSGKNIGGRK